MRPRATGTARSTPTCPSIRAALADAAPFAPSGSGQRHWCPSIRAALADAAMNPANVPRTLRVSIDQSRVGRCGGTSAPQGDPTVRVHRSEPRWPMRRTSHNEVQRGDEGVHRSEPRWPMRRLKVVRVAQQVECPSIRAALADAAFAACRWVLRSGGVHRSEPRWPMRRLLRTGHDAPLVCPSIRAALADAAMSSARSPADW